MIINIPNTVTDTERKMIEEEFETFKHTYLHRIALEKVLNDLFSRVRAGKLIIEDKHMWSCLIEDIHYTLQYHDMDKMINYLYLSKRETHIIHRANSYHHLENLLPKKYKNYFEMILDWESAAITKPDKPLNAYDTLMTYYLDYRNEILPILSMLGMNSSYRVELELTEQEKIVTVDDIINCINVYRIYL